MEDNKKYMVEAIALARKNAESAFGGPFGAIVVKGTEIISAAVNTVTPDKDPTAHAEVNAIRVACKRLDTFDLSGCVLYTSCEPCPMCLSAAYWAHVDKIYFAADRKDAERAGFSDAFIYDQFIIPFNERSIPIEQILAKEGVEPFSIWENSDTKVPY